MWGLTETATPCPWRKPFWKMSSDQLGTGYWELGPSVAPAWPRLPPSGIFVLQHSQSQSKVGNPPLSVEMVSCVSGCAIAGTAAIIHLLFCAVLSSPVTRAILLQGWWAPLVVHPSGSTKSHPGCRKCSWQNQTGPRV